MTLDVKSLDIGQFLNHNHEEIYKVNSEYVTTGKGYEALAWLHWFHSPRWSFSVQHKALSLVLPASIVNYSETSRYDHFSYLQVKGSNPIAFSRS